MWEFPSSIEVDTSVVSSCRLLSVQLFVWCLLCSHMAIPAEKLSFLCLLRCLQRLPVFFAYTFISLFVSVKKMLNFSTLHSCILHSNQSPEDKNSHSFPSSFSPFFSFSSFVRRFALLFQHLLCCVVVWKRAWENPKRESFRFLFFSSFLSRQQWSFTAKVSVRIRFHFPFHSIQFPPKSSVCVSASV